jgi:uncharacterized coiled-coil DUF342 family protein
MAAEIDLDILGAIKEDKQEYFESQLRDFVSASVSQDDVESFRDKVEAAIQSVNERVTELREERKQLIREKQEIKDEFNQFGERDLDALRNRGTGRFHLDLYELGEEGIEGELRLLNRKLSDYLAVRSAFYRVKELKVYECWSELDAQSIRAQVHEKFSDLQEKKFDDVEDQIDSLESKLADLDDRIDAVDDELDEKHQRFRESIQEERRSDRDKLFELLREFARSVERSGLASDKLKQRIDDLESQLNRGQVTPDRGDSSRSRHRSRSDGRPGGSPPRPRSGGQGQPPANQAAAETKNETGSERSDLDVEELSEKHDLNDKQVELLQELRNADPDESLKEIGKRIDGIKYSTVKKYKSKLKEEGLIEG